MQTLQNIEILWQNFFWFQFIMKCTWQTGTILKDDKNTEEIYWAEDQKTLIIFIKHVKQSCMCMNCLHCELELAKRTCKIEGKKNFFFKKLTTMFIHTVVEYRYMTCSYMCIPCIPYHNGVCYFLFFFFCAALHVHVLSWTN